jgi:hypothetical protein
VDPARGRFDAGAAVKRRLAAGAALLAAAAATAQTTDTVLVPRDSTAGSLGRFRGLQGQVTAGRNVVVDAPATRSDLEILRSGTAEIVNVRARRTVTEISAVPLSNAKIRELATEIDRLSTNDAGTRRSFLAALREKKQIARMPFVGMTSMTIANTATAAVEASATSGELTVSASVAATLLTARGRDFAVRAAELDLLVDKAATNDAATSAFYTQYNETLDKIEAVLDSPTEANQTAFVADAALTKDAFLQIWPQLRQDPVRRSDAVRHFAGLMEQSPLKAQYELLSNFEPPSYSDIYAQSFRAVALFESGERFCSGYMLSEEWLLTAGHCLKRGPVEAMEVRITPGPGAAGITADIDGKWPLSGTGRFDSDPIDYVFLHVAPSAALAESWADISQRAPLCLTVNAPGYEKPVIVIAHRPGEDSAKVYDHAYVWFPFRTSQEEFDEISAMTGVKLQRLAEAWFKSPVKQVEFFNLNMASFENAYELSGTVREYRAERAGMSKRPYFGMDTDTFKGNSGAPVFSRTKQSAGATEKPVCVVGVFSGGALEGAHISESTWKQHEFAIPLTEVVAHVRSLDIGAENATDAQKASRQALLALLPQ